MRNNDDNDFNEFFGKDSEFLNNFFKSIFNTPRFKDLSNDKENFNNIEDELGKPTVIEKFKDADGFTYLRKTWKTDKGYYVLIETTDGSNPESISKIKSKSLNEQLKDAVEDENYELAAKLKKIIDEKES